MKKAKRTILYTLCLCTALLGFSCTKEMETEEHPAMPDVPCRVEFRIETEAATRATDHAVRNLNFYVYGNSGLVRSGYTISAFVPTMTLVPGTYRVYVVANAGSSLGQMDESELLVLSTPVTEQDGFLQNGAMYLSGMQTMTVAGSTTCRIVLRRAAAKISLNVRFGPEMEGARIVHVVPGNAPATGSVFGENRLTAADPQIEFPYPDLSSGNLSTLSMSYYQYENLAGSVGSITDPADRIDGKAPATASYVSIRVLWDGAYFDYKVYLGSNTTSDFNVRRNTLYDYDVTIEGVNADDLRIAMTEIIFWVGRKLSIGGRYYRDGFYWNTRVAYSQLEIVTDNCDPGEEYAVSFRSLSGTFHSDWKMEYMIFSLPAEQREYKPIAPGERITVHKGNGTSVVIFAFSNYEGTKNYNTTDNYFEFTVCDSRSRGRTAVLSTNRDEWFK